MKDKLEKIRDLVNEVLREFEENKLSPLSEEDEFATLKSLLESQDWPKAVPDTQIADVESESDKDERAEGIVDILLPDLSGKKFLDFGCGEGHVVNYVSKSAALSVGYDRTKDPRSRFYWEQDVGNMMLTAEFDSVCSRGPYDVVLIYDVLDHAQDSSPVEILRSASSVLADGGRIYLRTHPWCSRHGGHLYRKINKAFVHLVFSESELSSMDLEHEYNIRVLAPISAYESWIEDSGLKNHVEPVSERQDVETFFRDNPVVRKRILKTFGKDEWTEACPVWQMSQSFWDYVLEKK